MYNLTDRFIKCYCFKQGIHHQVIIVTVEIHLVNASHGFLGMVAGRYRIPVAGQCFMEKLAWHIAQGKYQQEKYRGEFFYGLRMEQFGNFGEGSEIWKKVYFDFSIGCFFQYVRLLHSHSNGPNLKKYSHICEKMIWKIQIANTVI